MCACAHVCACACQGRISQVWRCTFEVSKQEDLRFKTSLYRYFQTSLDSKTLSQKERKEPIFMEFFLCSYVCVCV